MMFKGLSIYYTDTYITQYLDHYNFLYTIKIGRTKTSWNNHVYCQLDMLANIVNKGFNNFTQGEYVEGKSQIFFT